MRLQAIFTVIRDALFLLVGFGGIVYQQLTGQVNPWLLAVYTTMLGIPGAIGLLQLRGKPAPRDTPGPSSAHQSSSSSPQ